MAKERNENMKKYVYAFKEGNASMRNLLGGKGANLAEMTNLGLPIPQGFTVSTEACTEYYKDGKTINEDIQNQIFEALTKLEEMQGKKISCKISYYNLIVNFELIFANKIALAQLIYR